MDCGIALLCPLSVNTLGKGMNPLILLAMGQILALLSFSKDGFGIK